MFPSCYFATRSTRGAWFFAVLAAGVLAATATAQPVGAGRVRLANSFREVTPVGKAVSATHGAVVRDALTAEEAGKVMNVQLPLRTRNADELARRVAAGEIISREEMSARFLPDEADFKAVADWLASQGLTVLPMGESRSMVIAQGTPAQLAAAFGTRFARVQYKGEEHTSATDAPSLPAGVEARVYGVHGLQPHLHARKHLTVNPINIANGEPPFLPDDILKAYNIASTGLDGSGEAIGIIIDSVPQTSDITHFWTYNGVPQTLDRFSVVNVNGHAPGPREGEETIDVDWTSGIASGARIIVYNVGDLNNSNEGYARVLDDLQANAQPGLHQLSISFGAGERTDEYQDDIDAVHSLFSSITAYGVSIFASSGDDGAYGNAKRDTLVQANYPASDPLVVGVGGTTLTLDANSSRQDETGWSLPGPSDEPNESSGGGYSIYFGRPSYQSGNGVNTSAGAMRQVPDVALNGDPNTPFYVYYNGRVDPLGGTSVSAPCWAGMCALINQARASRGLSSINTFNSLVYPLLGTNAFHDITVGTNGAYNCTAGYDLVTGLGSPDFGVLEPQLASINNTPPAAHRAFFTGEIPLGNSTYYLSFPSGNAFGYYSYLADQNYIYHYDMGYEYVFDAADGKNGVYLYDFKSGHFFYSSPTFPFPYLYDFSLNTVLYYYPNPANYQQYNTNGVRYFYRFDTHQIFVQ